MKHPPEPVGHVRLGYARASTARQSLDAQLDSLAEAGVTRIFSEKISTRATRPRANLISAAPTEIRSASGAAKDQTVDRDQQGRHAGLAPATARSRLES